MNSGDVRDVASYSRTATSASSSGRPENCKTDYVIRDTHELFPNWESSEMNVMSAM